jgi:hypothetical protein
VASRALLCDEPDAMVWLPNRHTAIVAPVEGDPAPLERWLGPIAARAFRDGPGSIAPNPLRLRNGRLDDP